MGVEIRVNDLTKRFGSQTIWEGVTCTIPSGEVSVMLGPSGTGKSVFLKHLIGLLKPTRGEIYIDGTDITKIKEKDLYEIRKLFGVLFQDGALFGSMNIYDNTAFPLREHTRKNESEIKRIVMEKLDVTGLIGSEKKLPGEISGGMRKRAGLARALVLDPEILLFDEPDSGLDPVRTAYLNQLIIDLNSQIGATMLIVTHDINTARTVPDNIGLLYRRHLAMFGPREMLLSSGEPVVLQFLNAMREGPIGMAEEKDAAELASEVGGAPPVLPPIPPQLTTSDGSHRPSARAAGAWLRENNVTPPLGSYMGECAPKDWSAGRSIAAPQETPAPAVTADTTVATPAARRGGVTVLDGPTPDRAARRTFPAPASSALDDLLVADGAEHVDPPAVPEPAVADTSAARDVTAAVPPVTAADAPARPVRRRTAAASAKAAAARGGSPAPKVAGTVAPAAPTPATKATAPSAGGRLRRPLRATAAATEDTPVPEPVPASRRRRVGGR